MLAGLAIIKAYSKVLSGVCLVAAAQQVSGTQETLFPSDHRVRCIVRFRVRLLGIRGYQCRQVAIILRHLMQSE